MFEWKQIFIKKKEGNIFFTNNKAVSTYLAKAQYFYKLLTYAHSKSFKWAHACLNTIACGSSFGYKLRVTLYKNFKLNDEIRSNKISRNEVEINVNIKRVKCILVLKLYIVNNFVEKRR